MNTDWLKAIPKFARGLIAWTTLLGAIVMILTHTVVPDWYVNLLFVTFTFYFGEKIVAKSTKTAGGDAAD